MFPATFSPLSGFRCISVVLSAPLTTRPKPLLPSFWITVIWRKNFASDPGAVGRSVRLNSISAMIVGVADPHFTNFASGKFQDFYMPLSLVTRVLSDMVGDGRPCFRCRQFLGCRRRQASAGRFDRAGRGRRSHYLPQRNYSWLQAAVSRSGRSDDPFASGRASASRRRTSNRADALSDDGRRRNRFADCVCQRRRA